MPAPAPDVVRGCSARGAPPSPNARRSGAPRRRRERAVLLLAVAMLPAGCVHRTPYYGGPGPHWAPWVDDADVDHRLLLIGDAGRPDPAGEPALIALSRQVNRIPQRTTVVFLGDNVYERGMPPPAPPAEPATEAAVEVAKVLLSDVFQTRTEAERVLDAQIAVVRGTGARAIFLPGNHDWDQFEAGGRERILALEQYLHDVRAREGLDVSLQPPSACPGPVTERLGERGVLVAIDTQWWLEERREDKAAPDNNPAGCPYVTEEAVREAMLEALTTATRRGLDTVVVGHHPLRTNGAHGGVVGPWTHLFPAQIAAAYVPFYVEWLPLPVIGSLVVGLRACCSPSAQDIPNRRNRRMRSAVMRPMEEAARRQAAPLVYAAGHDHDLQVFESRNGPPYLLVSGLGSAANASPVGDDRRTLFAHSNTANPGFMQMDFLRDGRVRLAVLEHVAEGTPPAEVYSRFLERAGGESNR